MRKGRGKGAMIIQNNRIIEATEAELFDYYLKREMDDIYPFDQYMKLMQDAGTKIVAAQFSEKKDGIMRVEGYMMFNGLMAITPKSDSIGPLELTGVWLYRPDTDCWYWRGRSFTADICRIKQVNNYA